MKPIHHPPIPTQGGFSRFIALALVTVMLLSTTSCSVWNWLWTRDDENNIDSNDLIIGETKEAVTDTLYEGAIQYTGEAHSGTDIYYRGDENSPNSHRIIVIDAGHQQVGSDVLEPNGPGAVEDTKKEVSWGTVGVQTQTPEYELNLAVALLLRDELIRRGYSVVMIRETNNVSVSNMKRALIANKYNADAFIRIHANEDSDSELRGAMTISQSAANPYPTCAAHYEQSNRLSRLVLDYFCQATESRVYGLYEMDDMTATNWSLVPTTIIELGFLSNKSDDLYMQSDHFRQKAATGIANALDAYFIEQDMLESASEEDASASEEPTESAS